MSPSSETPIASSSVKTSHPPTSKMVHDALQSLDDRRGSSIQAIKKYIAATYLVDLDKSNHYINKYLKSAVDKGEIIQTKGQGASGSFKLPNTKKTEAKKSKAEGDKVAKRGRPKKTEQTPKSKTMMKKTARSPTAKPKVKKAKSS